MSSELDKQCYRILDEFNNDALTNMQKQSIKYAKSPLVRICTDINDKTCYLCVKKPLYYETVTMNLICWKHANELARSKKI